MHHIKTRGMFKTARMGFTNYDSVHFRFWELKISIKGQGPSAQELSDHANIRDRKIFRSSIV